MIMEWSLTKFLLFVSIRNSKWPPPQNKFIIGPYGKNIIKTIFWNLKTIWHKHGWNVPWMVKICVFCVHLISKMAAIKSHSFNMWSYRKMKKKEFFKYYTRKWLNQYINSYLIVIFIFCVDWKSKLPDFTGYCITMEIWIYSFFLTKTSNFLEHKCSWISRRVIQAQVSF